MLKATFVRRLDGRDRVYVTRTDGTTTGWDFPSYGAGLPHDLCHLVVEDELAMTDGFWGLVDDGVEVGVVDNRATLMRTERPLTHGPGADIQGLLAAERAVAAWTGIGVAATGEYGGQMRIDPEIVAQLTKRLMALQAHWADLEDGGSVTLEFSGRQHGIRSPLLPS